jgi:Flp pilus assembly protein TadD
MPRSFCEGLAAYAEGDAAAVESAFSAASEEMEKLVREQPDYAEALSILGMSHAALGQKEAALAEARRAVQLFPLAKDGVMGPELLRNLAIVYGWIGEKELAVQQLDQLVKIPAPISYGQLRLHPWWDPLRDDSRFERIIEESKKPVALK